MNHSVKSGQLQAQLVALDTLLVSSGSQVGALPAARKIDVGCDRYSGYP